MKLPQWMHVAVFNKYMFETTELIANSFNT